MTERVKPAPGPVWLVLMPVLAATAIAAQFGVFDHLRGVEERGRRQMVFQMGLPQHALRGRYRQVEDFSREGSLLRSFVWSLGEGFLWGLCVWFKPHSLLLAAGVYVVSLWMRWQARTCWKRVVLDLKTSPASDHQPSGAVTKR